LRNATDLRAALERWEHGLERDEPAFKMKKIEVPRAISNRARGGKNVEKIVTKRGGGGN